jgi:hypothetical protein
MIRLASAVALAITIAACASTTTTTARRERNLITREEIASLNVSTAYQIIQHLRPEYLRTRGPTSIQIPEASVAAVYLNGVRLLDGIRDLHRIQASDVESIHFMGAADATTRWGTNHTGGAIEITGRSS